MKKILALLLALAVLVGAWWYASPLVALDGLRDAAQAGNEEELRERVDFPALRASLKQRLRDGLSDAASSGGDSLGASIAAMGMGFVEPIVDGFVTPEWVATAVVEGQARREQMDAAREALPVREPAGPDTPGTPRPYDPDADQAASKAEPTFDVHREGFNTVRVTTQTATGEVGPTLHFTRDGLGWDLVDIEFSAAELLP